MSPKESPKRCEQTLKQCKDLFESISCLCAEGPEFMGKLQITEAVLKDAMKGYNLCKEALK